MSNVQRILFVSACALGFASSAHAQEATAPAQETVDESADREARALFDAGSVAFAEGRYESALRHLQDAYALSPRPAMLYNLGTTYDRLRRDEEALDAFRRYLAASPDAENRAEVAARIAVIEQARAQASERPADEPLPTPVTAPLVVQAPPSSSGDPLPIALLISGGVFVIGGVATLAFGLMDASAVESAMGVPYSDIRAQYERAPILQGVGGAALGVGVALVVVGGLSLSLASTSEARVSLTPGGLQLEGTF